MSKSYLPFTQRVIDTIKAIPLGQVMTYGEVARTAGSPRGARQVVRILHSLSDVENLPWHRVVNKNHEITTTGITAKIQKQLLENEGVFLNIKDND